MTNHAPTTNGYKPSAPPSTLIKSHGTGDKAEEVVQSRQQKATRTGQPTRQQHHPLRDMENLKLLHSYWAERDYKGFATLV
jgi:hypothetical protein